MTLETQLPTHLESQLALENLLSAFADSLPLDENLISTATIGISESIQIRDFALGAIGHALPIEDSVRFVSMLGLIGKESAGLCAIYGAYLYEWGNKELANKALDKSLELESDYSLALLLRRVFSANWPIESFRAMRNELHPKVVEGLKDLEGVAVNEK